MRNELKLSKPSWRYTVSMRNHFDWERMPVDLVSSFRQRQHTGGIYWPKPVFVLFTDCIKTILPTPSELEPPTVKNQLAI